MSNQTSVSRNPIHPREDVQSLEMPLWGFKGRFSERKLVVLKAVEADKWGLSKRGSWKEMCWKSFGVYCTLEDGGGRGTLKWVERRRIVNKKKTIVVRQWEQRNFRDRRIGLNDKEIGNRDIPWVEFMQQFVVVGPHCSDVAGKAEGSGSFCSEVDKGQENPSSQGLPVQRQKSDCSAFSFLLQCKHLQLSAEEQIVTSFRALWAILPTELTARLQKQSHTDST